MDEKTLFQKRLDKHYDELKWLYCELYEDGMERFPELLEVLKTRFEERPEDLKALDKRREADPGWYKKNDMSGMMMYVNAFAGTLKGVEKKLGYLEDCGVNYIHLMPLLDSPAVKNDGGYAVSDFTKVKPELGTMEDLKGG